MTAFPNLFSPLTIRNVTMPNRIFSSGHLTHFAENNLPSDRHNHYYEARAKGGIGMICMEVQSVSRHCWPVPSVCFADTDEIIDRYKMISDAVHPYDTKLFAQLWHNGHHTHSKISWLPVQSASSVPSPAIGEVPKALEEEEIQEIVQQYAQAALRLKKGGFDGVEIHAGHGYLPQQFLSPYSNRRTDKYGGSLENRMRFSVEIIDAVREAVGEDFVVGLRTSGDELVESGIHLPEMLEVCQAMGRNRPGGFPAHHGEHLQDRSRGHPSHGHAAASVCLDGCGGEAGRGYSRVHGHQDHGSANRGRDHRERRGGYGGHDPGHDL